MKKNIFCADGNYPVGRLSETRKYCGFETDKP